MQHDYLNMLDGMLTKASAASLVTGSGGAVIVHYDGIDEALKIWLTDWAIPINVALAIILAFAKVVTMGLEKWMEYKKLKIVENADLREEQESLERRHGNAQDTGQRTRRFDLEKGE